MPRPRSYSVPYECEILSKKACLDVLYVCVNTSSPHIAVNFLGFAQPQGYEELAAGCDGGLGLILNKNLLRVVSCSGPVTILVVFPTRHAGGEVLKMAVQTKYMRSWRCCHLMSRTADLWPTPVSLRRLVFRAPVHNDDCRGQTTQT